MNYEAMASFGPQSHKNLRPNLFDAMSDRRHLRNHVLTYSVGLGQRLASRPNLKDANY
jgi:hypothetical protein